MKKIYFAVISTIIFLIAFVLCSPADVHSIMGDKAEVPLNLEVSGAEALCQTDDGYVWIAQYSGLTRYDSDEYVTYKSFN